MGNLLQDYTDTAIKFMESNGYKLEDTNDHEYYNDFYFSKNNNPLQIHLQITAEFDAYMKDGEFDHIDFVMISSSEVSAILDAVARAATHTKGKILYKDREGQDGVFIDEKGFIKALKKDLKEIEKDHKERLAPKLVKEIIVAIHIEGVDEWKKEYYWFLNNPDDFWAMVKEAGMEDELTKAATTFGILEIMPPEARDLFLF